MRLQESYHRVHGRGLSGHASVQGEVRGESVDRRDIEVLDAREDDLGRCDSGGQDVSAANFEENARQRPRRRAFQD